MPQHGTAQRIRQRTLDRRQRDAVREEIALYVGVCAGSDGELKVSVLCGDRARYTAALDRLRKATATLDTIGWSESADSPEVQAIDPAPRVRTWAARQARELLAAFDEFVPADVHLDAYQALRVIGGI